MISWPLKRHYRTLGFKGREVDWLEVDMPSQLKNGPGAEGKSALLR